MTKLYSLYLLTNAVNGKGYVGLAIDPHKRLKRHLHDARPLAEGGSNCLLYRAIRKYGANSFSLEVLASGFTRAEAAAQEVALISKLGTRSPLGYNMTQGGEGATGLTPESRAKITASLKIRWAQPGAKLKLSEQQKGRKHTLESRALMSKQLRGKPISEAAKIKMRAAKIGKSHSPEHSAKIAAAHKARFEDPKARQRAAEGQKSRYRNPDERRLASERTLAVWKKRKEDKAEEIQTSCLRN